MLVNQTRLETFDNLSLSDYFHSRYLSLKSCAMGESVTTALILKVTIRERKREFDPEEEKQSLDTSSTRPCHVSNSSKRIKNVQMVDLPNLDDVART